MGVGEFMQSAERLIKTLSRPDWKTFSLSVKIVFAGVGILGAIGYLIRLISVTLSGISI
jgi:protein translocase SEC61 complex gamma subunit